MKLLAEHEGRFDLVQIERIMLDLATALAVYHRAGEVHGHVSPTTIAFDGTAAYLLEQRSSDPEFSDRGPPSARGDVFAAVRVLQYLLAGTKNGTLNHVSERLFGSKLASFIARCTRLGRRPDDGDGLLAELRALSISPVLASVERPQYRAADPVEDSLLEAVWRSPDDHARSVYLDWLEQHGHDSRLAFLRDDVASDGDAAWRAVVARTPVVGCPWKCGKRWDLLAHTPDDLRRHCMTCDSEVRYCTSLEVAYDIGSRWGSPITIYTVDAALTEAEVTRIVDARKVELAADPDGRHPRMMRPGGPYGFCPACNRDLPLDDGCPTHGELLPITSAGGMRTVQLGSHRVAQQIASGMFAVHDDRDIAIEIGRGDPSSLGRGARVREVGSEAGWNYAVIDRTP